MEAAMFWANGAELSKGWQTVFAFFLKQDGKNPLYVKKPVPPIHLFGYTPFWIEGKTQGVTFQSHRYFPLWEMGVFKQREMCSMSPATFSPLSFTHRKGDQPSMMLFSPPSQVLPAFHHIGLTPPFPEQTGGKLPCALAPFALFLMLHHVRFNTSWEKGLG